MAVAARVDIRPSAPLATGSDGLAARSKDSLFSVSWIKEQDQGSEVLRSQRNNDLVGRVISYQEWDKNGTASYSRAAAVWGDRAMWYLIADANGLTGAEPLSAGQTLTIPNKIANIHNSASTFRPYSPGEAIGDTSPTLPDPPPPPQDDDDCGGIGQILVVIVAVVVTIYTAGAAATYFGAATANMSAYVAGTSALGGSLGAAGLAGAVVGGAVGSIASQGVAMAMGMQDQFSWSQVGMSAIGAGVTAGLGASSGLTTSLSNAVGPVGTQMALGAVRSTITQGIGVVTGLQKKFDWRGVAAAAISAGVGSKVGDTLKGWNASDSLQRFGSSLAGGMASGAVYGNLRNNFGAIAADAIGSTLGNVVAQRIAGKSTYIGLNTNRADGVGLKLTPGDQAAFADGLDLPGSRGTGPMAYRVPSYSLADTDTPARLSMQIGEGNRYAGSMAEQVLGRDVAPGNLPQEVMSYADRDRSNIERMLNGLDPVDYGKLPSPYEPLAGPGPAVLRSPETAGRMAGQDAQREANLAFYRDMKAKGGAYRVLGELGTIGARAGSGLLDAGTTAYSLATDPGFVTETLRGCEFFNFLPPVGSDGSC